MGLHHTMSHTTPLYLHNSTIHPKRYFNYLPDVFSYHHFSKFYDTKLYLSYPEQLHGNNTKQFGTLLKSTKRTYVLIVNNNE